MTRKRWLLVAAAVAVLCLACGGVGVAYLAQNVPAVARLFRGAPDEPTAIPIGAAELSLDLPTATVTPDPTATATEIPPSPTATPSATATTAPADPPGPAASMTAAVETAAPTSTTTPTPTWTATLTPTRTASPTPVPPTPTPRPQWIAFESKRGENKDYEIVVVKPDGSRQANFTNSWADDVAPAWAPTGRHIAFVSFRDTVAGKWGMGKGAIYVKAFDLQSGQGGEVWRVTDDGGSEGWPTWSPDGQRIAFQSDRSGNWDIWISNVDGTGLAQLTRHPAEDRFADWSPDGKKIAFTSKRSGNEEVWVVDVQAALEGGDDSGAINLTNCPAADRYPFWSPNGKQLTFNTKRDGNFEVYVMNADGSKPRNVSRSPGSTEGLADWSPDGKRLVFYSNRGGNKEVYVLDLASLAWTNISNHPASDEFCAWSP